MPRTAIRRLGSCLVGLVCLLSASAARAQLSTAQLSGTIRDEAGAVVPGAAVVVTQTDTGLSRGAVTGPDGSYVLSNLPNGPYRVQITLEGFRTYVRTGLILEVGTASVIDAVLSVGALEEVVTVDETRPLVDVQSAGTSVVVRNDEILALPLNGRNPVELVTLTGAAVQTTGSSVTVLPGGMGISVAGGQSFGVMYLLDGAMHSNPQDHMSLPLPFPDALQEFSVATSALVAQHGMHSGAAVNAVTRSGTNRLSGNAFEFFRDRRFNATNPFAPAGPDGQRADDGLQRHQFGGTIGGPLVRDRLFVFAGVQATTVRQRPAANIAWVPTPAMLAGDFTAAASPACNGGRQVVLRGGFVNNRIDPARFSPAAMNLVQLLPESADPCGQVTYTQQRDNNQAQIVSRLDFRRTEDDSIFARYMATTYTQVVPMGPSDTVLSLYDAVNGRGESGFDDLAQSLALGDTRVAGATTVNALRVALNRSVVERFNPDTFGPSDLGVDAYGYHPHVMAVLVQGGFTTVNQGPSRFVVNAAQVSDDLTLVRGRHQVTLGSSLAYWRYRLHAHARSGGVWFFTGQATGLGLADLLTGRLGRLEHGGPGNLPMDQWYLGLFAQDSWRAGDRVTLNLGLRWEPYFAQNILNGAVYNFSRDNFRANIGTSVFRNAPAGLLYPGDDGFPSGRNGVTTKWWNLSPRAGVAWDVAGDGRTALRASYGLLYDFPTADYQLMNAQAPPFGNRTLVEEPPGGFDRPYEHLGGDPHPITTSPDTVYVPFGAFGATDPGANAPRVHQWNVTVERQLGAIWQVAASYFASHTDRLWNQVALNPGVFLGLDRCALDGVVYPVCSTPQNLNQRRALSISNENPASARLLGNLDLHTSLGTQDYRGLRVSAQNRVVHGVRLAANYTISRCNGDPSLQTGSFPLLGAGYTDPDDPSFDRGTCDQDRTHLTNVMASFETPRFAGGAVGWLMSDWMVSGIFSARSGAPLNVVAGQDRAMTGILNQRANQVLEHPYGARTLETWLNPDAFELPAPGTLGNFRRNSLRAPGYWSLDVALSKFFTFGATQRLELRVEAFNVFNTFNWGSPAAGSVRGTDASLSSGTFGRITTMAGSPRVMQFGVKYGF